MTTTLRLSAKLPALIVGSALVIGVGIGIGSYLTASASTGTLIAKQLAAASQTAQGEIEDYLEGIATELTLVAENPFTMQALFAFRQGFSALDNPTETLQAAYITDNPHPLGQKDQLRTADTGTSYDTAHGSYHGWFHELQQDRGYYDVFLFDSDGNLVYSVFKEADYATNFATPSSGPWADTDLGNVFRRAMQAPDTAPIVFEDFEPYAPSADAPASFIAKAITNVRGDRVGVLAFQMPIDNINAVFNQIRGIGETGEAVLLGTNGLMRNDSRFTADVNDILTTRLDGDFVQALFADGEAKGRAEFHRGEPMLAHGETFSFLGADYAVITMETVREAFAPLAAMRNQMLLVGLALLALITIAGLFAARSVTRPISALVEEMGVLAKGDTSVELAGASRTDEIGDMTKAVAVFRDSMIERERLEGESAKASAERRARQKQIDELISKFEADVQEVIASVSANADQMTQAANTLTQVAHSTDEEATSAAGASTEAATNVQTVAAAAEELSASITEIGRQVEKTNQIVGDAAVHAQSTNAQVERLAETANAIGNVIALIQDIAEQTNLLALNATIEAARAGEAGKGFAVVASEVKGLANQTAKATGDIAAQISEIQASTREAVEAINQITTTMGDVDQYMSAIAAAVEEQGAATDEISHNVAQAAQGTQIVASNINNVTQATTQTSQSASAVNDAASSVTANTRRLNETVSSFLKAVAAA